MLKRISFKLMGLLLVFAMVIGYLPSAQAAESNMTRSGFVSEVGKIYEAMQGVPLSSTTNFFDDVRVDADYSAYVNWAVKLGVINGVGGNLFAPDREITREEIAVMLFNLAKVLGQEPQGAWAIHLSYSDINEVSDWAGSGVMYCTLKQLVDAKPGNRFAPKDVVSSTEALDMLSRFFNTVVQKVSNEELYSAAVIDAMTIEADELYPIVRIAKDDPLTTWNNKNQVLLLTHHKYPDSYIAGEDYVTQYGEVWVFTDKEISEWYKNNQSSVENFDMENWDIRFKQLIGLPPEREYTHFSAMWVNPEDLTRPAYETDITAKAMITHFAEAYDTEFKAWFDSNIVWSYFDSAYPWTRLGYTYDWANTGNEYGLSEFVIRKDATVTVEFTKTTEEFVEWLSQQ